MLFPTYSFFLIFIPILILNWTLKRWPKIWKIFLLAVSYLFYATWDARFLITLISISLASYILGKRIFTQTVAKQKLTLALAVMLAILTLVIFKYYDFFRVSFETILNRLGFHGSLPFFEILLPIGLSFYILRALAYVIDVYRGDSAPFTLTDLLIYIAFFPQLLSGPIARPKPFVAQLQNGGAKTVKNLHENFALILTGLFKKIVLASALGAGIVDPVFAVPAQYTAIETMLAVYAYAIVIYCDFSGYSDMAIGIAGLMGFQSPINFLKPYSALSLNDFWHRWHITFSEWLRDYVYIPLGGNRKGKIRRGLNTFITMIVSGFWHGVGGVYLVWGALHGLGLILQNQFPEKINPLVSKIITFHFVCLAWIFFRASAVEDALAILGNLADWRIQESRILSVSIFIIIFAAYVFICLEQNVKTAFIKTQNKLPIIGQIAVISAIVVFIIEMGPDIVPPFIYFQF